LKGFCRIALAAGKSEKVTITIDHRDLQHWGTASNGWELEKGAAIISVGSSSADIRLTGNTSL
jgi:beta-glucosidase